MITVSPPSATAAHGAPTAPTSLLARHTLPPEEWGNPTVNSLHGVEEDYWKGITGHLKVADASHPADVKEDATQLVEDTNTRVQAFFESNTLVGCEGFLMQKVNSAKENGYLLTWQQRYVLMDPSDCTLTMWDIPAGAVVVSRPKGKGRNLDMRSFFSVKPSVSKNNTRFDIHMRANETTTGDEVGDVLSLMADTPEDCLRWVNAIKMVLKALSLSASRSSATASPKVSASQETDGKNLERFFMLAKDALARDPTLKGRVIYGLPAFFQAIDREGQGVVSDLEFEGAIKRLGISTPGSMIEALSRDLRRDPTTKGQLNYREFVSKLIEVVKMEMQPKSPRRPSPSPKKRSPKKSPRQKSVYVASPTVSSQAKAEAATQKAASLSQAARASQKTSKASSAARSNRNGRHLHLRIPAASTEVAQENSSKDRRRGTAKRENSGVSQPIKSKKSRKTKYKRPWLSKRGKRQGQKPADKATARRQIEVSTAEAGASTTSRVAQRKGEERASADTSIAIDESFSSTRSDREGLKKNDTFKTKKIQSISANKIRSAAIREETAGLHKALTSAQQLIAAETRARIKAEKSLTRQKRLDEEARRKIELDQVARDEANAKNLDKLHAMYGRQIEKLRNMLQHEGDQLARAREEIADLTISIHNAASKGVRIELPRSRSSKTSIDGRAIKDAVSLAAAEKGAADLVLLERLASLEEELANVRDREKLLENENQVIKSQLAETLSKAAERKARVDTAENISKELRKALSLSKEESKLLDGERRRLMRENEKLAKAVEKMDRFVYGKTPQYRLTSVGAANRNRSFDSTAAAAIAAAKVEKAAQFALGRGANRQKGKSFAQRQAEATDRLSKSFSAAPKGFLSKQKLEKTRKAKRTKSRKLKQQTRGSVVRGQSQSLSMLVLEN